jgi:hypothetical protein
MSLLLENIHRIIDDSMKVNNIPGAVFAVLKTMRLFYPKDMEGLMLRIWDHPSVQIHYFRIASVSKLFKRDTCDDAC